MPEKDPRRLPQAIPQDGRERELRLGEHAAAIRATALSLRRAFSAVPPSSASDPLFSILFAY